MYIEFYFKLKISCASHSSLSSASKISVNSSAASSNAGPHSKLSNVTATAENEDDGMVNDDDDDDDDDDDTNDDDDDCGRALSPPSEGWGLLALLDAPRIRLLSIR
ncbi:hypothetical protein PUN28_014633 [Cardiocondyla obscurior]|uniref:Uncharacterized protein n=1 Tax=Cardiocondyla obscurior TaxID=286306 RepID=A0AAW2F3P2_9HYME